MSKKIKILYVEDEPFLGKIVKESLESRQFTVNMVTDGLHAVPAFQQFCPDICILDVMLPNKDGFSIGEEIRRLDPNIPIIFLTAKTQTEDLLKGFESGGNDYVRKPFSMEELIIRIQNLISLTGGKSPELQNGHTITFGSFAFHLGKHELMLGNTIQKLSHREAQLLKILHENRNQALDRKVILKALWGDDSFFNSRNLDVYITKLRGYLKADPGVQIITLKGVGYHFLVE